jgi:hypothetical protein
MGLGNPYSRGPRMETQENKGHVAAQGHIKVSRGKKKLKALTELICTGFALALA